MVGAQLRALVAERNVRRIVVHVTRQTARELREAPASLQALDVLHTHGFRVELAVRGDSGQTTVSERWSPVDAHTHAGASWLPDNLSALHVVEDRLNVDGDTSKQPRGAEPAVSLPSMGLERTNTLQRLAAGLAVLPSQSVRLFGSHLVSVTQVFYESALSFGLVNLKPIVPGHILVVPKRRVDRFSLLGHDEVSDLWCAAQLAGSVIQRHYDASSLTFAIQDGPEAGQTVPHVHIHAIPRREGDFAVNDVVYTEIEAHERHLHADHTEEPRRARPLETMAAEAEALRALFPTSPTR